MIFSGHSLFMSPLISILSIWMISEALYYPTYLYTLQRLQVLNKPSHKCFSQEQRKAFFLQCIESMLLSSGDDHKEKRAVLEECFSRWFHSAPFHSLQRQNFLEWLAWAFYDDELVNFSREELKELNDLADYGESQMGYKFPEGHNPEVSCIRLTRDPIFSIQRPLIYYIVIALLQALGSVCIWALGFRKAYVKGHTYYYRHPEASTRGTEDSSNPLLKGENSSRANKPVVFIHGIGAGLVIYLRFLKEMPTNTTVYLLEWPHVSMTYGSENVPSVNESVDLLHHMLAHDGYSEAVFAGHSLGSSVISWLLRGDARSRSLVASTILIDPIVFLLSDPSVVYNFIHRAPSDSVEIMMHYFVARELYIANTLSREFSWSHTIMFAEDFPTNADMGSKNNTIVLSGEDAIVPVRKVKSYLDAYAQKSAQGVDSKKKKVNHEVIWYPTLHHGEMVLNGPAIKAIASRMQELI
eukprot:Nk52_evm65s158 gene=Nk52_evmTU65s158